MEKPPIKIGIAEDHDLVRQGMIALLEEEEDLNIIIEANNGRDILDKMNDKKIDILLLDIDMPVMDGFEVLAKMKQKQMKAKAIIVSMHYNDDFLTKAVDLGARGFLPKNSNIEVVIEAIRIVHKLGFYFDERVAERVVHNINNHKKIEDRINHLTDREKEIICLICDGRTSEEIGQKMDLSDRTVEGHRRRISEKTATTGIAELVVFALKNRIYTVV